MNYWIWNIERGREGEWDGVREVERDERREGEWDGAREGQG